MSVFGYIVVSFIILVIAGAVGIRWQNFSSILAIIISLAVFVLTILIRNNVIGVYELKVWMAIAISVAGVLSIPIFAIEEDQTREIFIRFVDNIGHVESEEGETCYVLILLLIFVGVSFFAVYVWTFLCYILSLASIIFNIYRLGTNFDWFD